jgi:hypothetical protein
MEDSTGAPAPNTEQTNKTGLEQPPARESTTQPQESSTQNKAIANQPLNLPAAESGHTAFHSKHAIRFILLYILAAILVVVAATIYDLHKH